MTVEPLQHHPLAKLCSLHMDSSSCVGLLVNRTVIPLNFCVHVRVCVFYWLPMYPLIRDRCGPLGSHQAKKEARFPPYFLPPFSLSPAKTLHCMSLPPRSPQEPHYTRMPEGRGIEREQNGDRHREVQRDGEREMWGGQKDSEKNGRQMQKLLRAQRKKWAWHSPGHDVREQRGTRKTQKID